MLQLVKDRKVLHRTTTVLLSAVLVVLSLLEIIEPYLQVVAPVISTGMFPWISAGVGIAIGIGRYIRQDLAQKDDGEEDAS